MRRNRHRLKSRAAQEQARRMRGLHMRSAATRSVLAAFVEFAGKFVAELDRVVSGLADSAERFERSLWVTPVWAWRDEREGDFSVRDHQGARCHPAGWDPDVIDVEGGVVEAKPSPSALEVHRERER